MISLLSPFSKLCLWSQMVDLPNHRNFSKSTEMHLLSLLLDLDGDCKILEFENLILKQKGPVHEVPTIYLLVEKSFCSTFNCFCLLSSWKVCLLDLFSLEYIVLIFLYCFECFNFKFELQFDKVLKLIHLACLCN